MKRGDYGQEAQISMVAWMTGRRRRWVKRHTTNAQRNRMIVDAIPGWSAEEDEASVRETLAQADAYLARADVT